MNLYSIAKFLQIAGALGFFVALGLEWTSLRRLRGAMGAEQVREWILVTRGAGRVGIASMVLILVSGIYMMATAWGFVPWILVARGTLAVLAALTLALTGPRMADEGAMPPALQGLVHDPLLWVSVQVRVALALGIVFLMTVKPDLGGSLLATGAALALGLAPALPRPGRKRIQERTAFQGER